MTIFATYSSPTTPGAAAWQEPMAGDIRLGSITGLSGEARLGATGVGSITLDDPTSSIGHGGDGIVGLKQFHFTETACPVGNQRLWTGYVGPRTYKRGPQKQSSLRTGNARQIDVSLIDLNDFLSFRVFAPEDIDPTSSFVRGAETDLERVQGLLNDVDFLSTTLFDVGFIPSTGGVAMTAKDYTGMRPADVLNDCAQVSGRNFWVLYWEATNQFVLWYDDWQTDGSATLTYDSDLRLTNVLAERDGTTTFEAIDAELTYDPSRVISAIYLEGEGVTSYGTLPTTAYTFAWRDAVMPALMVVSDQTKLDDLAERYLADNSTEDPTIRCSVQLPTSKVTGIHEGMRLQVHFTHLPLVATTFTWCRVLSRNIRVDVETQEYYWLDLEMSPLPELPCPDQELTPEDYYPNILGFTSDATGNVAYWNAGTTPPTVPTPGWVGNWGFPVFGVADGGSPSGTYDTAWHAAGNHARCLVIGPGTLTVHTVPAFEYTNGTYIAYVRYRDNVTTFTIEERAGCVPGVDQDFDIPPDVLGVEGDIICHFWVDVEFTGAGIPGTRQIGFAGFDWVPA